MSGLGSGESAWLILSRLTMLDAPHYLQDFIKGALLVSALAFPHSAREEAGSPDARAMHGRA